MEAQRTDAWDLAAGSRYGILRRGSSSIAAQQAHADSTSINGQDIHKIVVASNGGMGSGVMLSKQLSKQLKNYPVQVQNVQTAAIPRDADVAVCHIGEAAGARGGSPSTVVVRLRVFHADPAIRTLISAIKEGGVLRAPLLNRPHGQHLLGTTPPAQVSDRVAAARRRTARRSEAAAIIEAAHPGWLVMYGAGAEKLFAFPMWQYTGDAITVSASTPAGLAEGISRVEAELRSPNRGRATVALGSVHTWGSPGPGPWHSTPA
jgi:hypothetical protein